MNWRCSDERSRGLNDECDLSEPANPYGAERGRGRELQFLTKHPPKDKPERAKPSVGRRTRRSSVLVGSNPGLDLFKNVLRRSQCDDYRSSYKKRPERSNSIPTKAILPNYRTRLASTVLFTAALGWSPGERSEVPCPSFDLKNVIVKLGYPLFAFNCNFEIPQGRSDIGLNLRPEKLGVLFD